MTKIRLPYVQEYSDRHGKVRRYFRRPGFKRKMLPGTPGSQRFMAAYEAALSAERPPIGRKHKDGTVGDLIAVFYRSAFFENLKPQSKRVYRLILDKFGQEDGHRLVRDMPRRVAMNIIEEIGETKPGMANLTASVMRRLFAYAVKKELRVDNPFSGIESYKLGTYHTWTEVEIATFEAAWSIGTRERLAFDLLLFTGQRVGDVAAMRRSDLRDGAIHVTQEKTGAKLLIPLHPKLPRSIQACPTNGLRLIGTASGRPTAAQAVSALIKRAAAAAGLPKECVPHGLRKGTMRRLAEHGSSSKEIAAVSGHRTLKEIERYTAAADQARLARSAVCKLPEEQK
jgi:integrase